jgi:Holliday junction DNA helicase RuvA
MATQSLAALSEKGSEVTVFTSLMIRENEVALYGFMSEREQHLFERLITVSGVGPKVALSALSSFNVEALTQIIIAEDVTRISTIPGIGKKTAQRIILELRGVLDALEAAGAPDAGGASSALRQASDALLGMGFTSAEVTLALKGSDDAEGGADSDVATLIRHALKKLGAA